MSEEKANKARSYIEKVPDLNIDSVLASVQITHEEYRKHYPDTPVTPALALDILEARDTEELTLENIKKRWNLDDSKLYYVLYNDNALKSKEEPLTKWRIEYDLRNSLKTQTEIALKYGVSQSHVHKIAKKLNALPDRKKRTTLSDEQVLEIKKANDSGESITSLAKKYKVSRDTIYKRLRGVK